VSPARLLPVPSETRMIILEDAANAFDHVRPASNETRPTYVVARNGLERPSHFALRTIRRVAGLESGNAAVTQVLFAVDGVADRQRRAARELMARSLVSHMIRQSGGELIVAAPSGCDSALSDELMELAGMLISESSMSSGARVRVIVKFYADEACAALESGIHERVSDATS
jgi:hypothetical protein